MSVISYAQTDSLSSSSSVTEFDTYFEGGRIQLYSIIQEHLKYPEELKEESKFGHVFYKVSIDTLGKITNIEILRSFDERANSTVLETIKFTEGSWKIKNVNGVKESYTWNDTIYFELR